MPSDWGTVLGIWWILTAGQGVSYLIAFFIGKAFLALRIQWDRVLFLIIGLIIPPALLLLLNAIVAPLFQTRYIIIILPMAALLVAYALDLLWLPERLVRLRSALILLILAWITFTQLTTYPFVWDDKPGWEEAFMMARVARDSDDPAITGISENSVEAYYFRLLEMRQGETLEVMARDHSPQEIVDVVSVYKNEPSVWAILPTNVPKSWDIVNVISQGRSVGYRGSVMNVILYRFDASGQTGRDLRFQYDEMFATQDDIGRAFGAKAGEPFCIDFHLTALQDIDGRYSAGVALTQAYNVVHGGWDGGIGSHVVGESFTFSPCIELPSDLAAGPYHVQLALYDWRTVRRLNVYDVAGDEPYFWGDAMIGAVVWVE